MFVCAFGASFKHGISRHDDVIENETERSGAFIPGIC